MKFNELPNDAPPSLIDDLSTYIFSMEVDLTDEELKDFEDRYLSEVREIDPEFWTMRRLLSVLIVEFNPHYCFFEPADRPLSKAIEELEEWGPDQIQYLIENEFQKIYPFLEEYFGAARQFGLFEELSILEFYRTDEILNSGDTKIFMECPAEITEEIAVETDGFWYDHRFASIEIMRAAKYCLKKHGIKISGYDEEELLDPPIPVEQRPHFRQNGMTAIHVRKSKICFNGIDHEFTFTSVPDVAFKINELIADYGLEFVMRERGDDNYKFILLTTDNAAKMTEDERFTVTRLL